MPTPMPRIFESRNLRVGFVAFRCFEKQVVIALGVERRVEIDEVDRFIANMFAEDLKV
jgi:hypothetical protein